jgi:spore coat protein A
MPFQSRIPEPMSVDDLRQYRWLEKLPVLGDPILGDIPFQSLTKGSTTKVYMGETKKPHVFARSPDGVLPELSQKVWGYGFAQDTIGYLGPVLIAKENEPVNIEWVNNLPAKHPFIHPMPDLAAPGSMMQRYSTGHAAVHMHGARVEEGCDGYPVRKIGKVQKTILRPPANAAQQGESETYEYPNEQPGGATLWFHDHAMDMTAKNVYAGLAGGYILRHAAEGNLPNIPCAGGKYLKDEIPLIIQDKSFTRESDSNGNRLLYGDVTFLNNRKLAAEADKITGNRDCSRGQTAFLRSDGTNDVLLPPSPEFKGNAICVNGKLWPTLEVEPRPYRFRIYNGANSRMFVLRLSNQRVEIDQSTKSIVSADDADTKGKPALPIYQIGSDGGIFSEAVELSGGLKNGKPTTKNFLVLAPGERADVIIDFSQFTKELNTGCCNEGIENILYLTNHAYTLSSGSANEQGTPLGNVGDHADEHNMMDTLLQIRFKPLSKDKPVFRHPAFQCYLDAINSDLAAIQPKVNPVPSTRTRRFIINEFPLYLTQDDAQLVHFSRGPWKAITFETPIGDENAPNVFYFGNRGFLWGGMPNATTVDQLIPPPPPQTNDYAGIPNGGPVADPADVGTATGGATPPLSIKIGTSETWEIFNLSGDVHPIHLHLVNFKVKSRETLDETVLAQVAESMKKLRPPKVVLPIDLIHPQPMSLQNAGVDKNELAWKDTVRANPGEKITLEVYFDGASPQDKDYSGNFVWHCHLIEHEDMGMMRPLKVEK